jgi:DNA mismatch repair protein MutL
MLIDQVLASERIAYEKYLNILQKKHGLSQQLLFPTSIELPIHLLTVVQNIESEIKNLGFSFTYSPNNTLILNGVPLNIEKNNEKEVFIEMLETYYQFYNEKKLAFDLQEKLALALAQKTSLKKGVKLEPVEMEKLIAQLFSCQNPNYSPLGAKTHVLVTLDQIRELLI